VVSVLKQRIADEQGIYLVAPTGKWCWVVSAKFTHHRASRVD
jgi:hypothetical protein